MIHTVTGRKKETLTTLISRVIKVVPVVQLSAVKNGDHWTVSYLTPDKGDPNG